ncbi:beta-propeller fold lactonase family protein [Brevibacillus sp. NRS-1366]|uniref:beta-propeller fold lactonase family protein n=1 Tax=Brevibacillus sp. NRS-1366 TaxID=3233899 RepID=UPI003D1D7032
MFSRLPLLSQIPVAVVYTPDSILQRSQPHEFSPSYTMMNRKRFSTCTDVEWFNNNQYLASANFGAESLHIYSFQSQDHTLTLVQSLNNQDGLQLHWPDKLAFSPNGKHLAITNIKGNRPSVNLYNIDPQTNLIQPIPIKVIEHPQAIFHGVQFSTNSQYLVSCSIDHAGLILIYKLESDENGALHITLSQVLQNHYSPLKPKSIDFSGDGSLMAVCYGPNAADSYPFNGALAVYAFDNDTGKISPHPLCELKETPELSYPDDVSFSHDAMSSIIVVPSQVNDTVLFYSFDKINKQIDPRFFAFTNPDAQLYFPHGLSLSSDNHYLAVSNYGDDKITIYSTKEVFYQE